jgi:uncharacterized membrane protein
MSQIKKAIVFLIVAVGLGSLLLAQESIQQRQSDKKVQTDRKKQISEGSYQDATEALHKAVVAKDKEAVTLAIQQRRFGPAFQIDAVRAVSQLNDKSLVPELLNALENNQGIAWRGGSEIEAEQKQLNKVIVATLEKFTGLKFSEAEHPTPEEIKIVLKVCRDWWKDHSRE